MKTRVLPSLTSGGILGVSQDMTTKWRAKVRYYDRRQEAATKGSQS